MIAITGATGQLGRLAIQQLLAVVPAAKLVAIVRDPAKAADLRTLGVQVRRGDYEEPALLESALAGVEQLLLISSNEIGRRATQHRNAIEAAKRAKVDRVVYTSLLHAERSPLSLAGEHLETEQALKESGLDYVILRNGWYTENYTASVKPALGLGALYGSAGSGRISSATRADLAAAAVKVLTTSVHHKATLELAGDESYTLGELAAEVSRQTGKQIPYVDIPEAAYRDALLKAGLPEGLAVLLAHSDVCVTKGALFDDHRQLSALLGRPTEGLAAAVKAALDDKRQHSS